MPRSLARGRLCATRAAPAAHMTSETPIHLRLFKFTKPQGDRATERPSDRTTGRPDDRTTERPIFPNLRPFGHNKAAFFVLSNRIPINARSG